MPIGTVRDMIYVGTYVACLQWYYQEGTSRSVDQTCDATVENMISKVTVWRSLQCVITLVRS